jgi:hypothetical protein
MPETWVYIGRKSDDTARNKWRERNGGKKYGGKETVGKKREMAGKKRAMDR